MDYKITLLLTILDKFKILFFLVFYYFPFLFLGFYLNKRNIINKFLLIPFSFLASSVFYGVLVYLFSLFNLKINLVFIIINISILFLYFFNVSFLFKDNFLRINFLKIIKNNFKIENILFYVLIFILFISFFSITSFPAGDAVLHISKINNILNNGFNFKSAFNIDTFDIAYLTNPAYLVLSLISYQLKFSSFSVWSFSLIFYLLLDFLALTGFLYWLFNNKLISFSFAFLYFLLFRQGISGLTFPYPNNQINTAFLLLIIFFINYIKTKIKNEEKLYLLLISLSILGYQFLHLAMSSLISFILLALILASVIFIKIFNLKFEIKKFFNLILILIISVLPLLIYVFFLIFKLKFNQGVLVETSDKTDPFILDLYSQYARFNLKSISFYFKDINLGDQKFSYFFTNIYFIQFLSFFLLIIISITKKLTNLFYFGLFSLILNILIFNFGFISQKILPLWLLMRIDQSYLVIFLTIFLIIQFLFEKINLKYGTKIFLAFLIFLNFSIVYKIQETRNYARYVNSGYQECEFFWKKVTNYVDLSGKIYVFEGCEEPQYLLNVITINSRYSEFYDIKKNLDLLFKENLKNIKILNKDKINYFINKAKLNYLIIRPCNKDIFNKFNKLINYQKFWYKPESDLNFCVFKIK